jgi:hypothetical protein
MTIYFIAAVLLAAAGIGLWRLSRGWKKPLKILTRIGAVSIILVSPVLLLAFLTSGAMCGRYDFPSVRAGNGDWIAGVSEEDCGAVDSFHSFVEIWSSRHTVLNPFASRLLGDTVFRVGDDPVLVHLKWSEPKVLVIRYPKDSFTRDEFFCASQWKDVQIKCIPYAPHYPYSVASRPHPKTWFRWFW